MSHKSLRVLPAAGLALLALAAAARAQTQLAEFKLPGPLGKVGDRVGLAGDVDGGRRPAPPGPVVFAADPPAWGPDSGVGRLAVVRLTTASRDQDSAKDLDTEITENRTANFNGKNTITPFEPITSVVLHNSEALAFANASRVSVTSGCLRGLRENVFFGTGST